MKNLLTHLMIFRSLYHTSVLKIEIAIALSVIKVKRGNSNVDIPPNVIKGKMLHFAIDNTDFNNDTPDGKHKFHGTGQIVIRKQSNSNISSLKKSRKIERSNDASFAFNSNDMFPVEVIMKKPNPPNESFPNFINFCLFRNFKYQIKQHKIWNLRQTFNSHMECF